MVLFVALAWSQVVDIDAVEPWYVGDARLSPSMTALASVDSNPQWRVDGADTRPVLGLRPGINVQLDVPDTLVEASLSSAFVSVDGVTRWPQNRWVSAEANLDVELYRRQRFGVRAAYKGVLRTDGGARDLFIDAPAFVTDVLIGVPVDLSDAVDGEIRAQFRSSNYRFWTEAWALQSYNSSDELTATTVVSVAVFEGFTFGARADLQRHAWRASSVYPLVQTTVDPGVVSLSDALRPVGVLTTTVSSGGWTLQAGMGWDGTQIRNPQSEPSRLALGDRLIAEMTVGVETASSSAGLSVERFNDRPIVADVSVVTTVDLTMQTDVVSFVRVGTRSGVRSDAVRADTMWRSTRVHGAVYGAVDLSANLTTTVTLDGAWRDRDPFQNRPLSRLAATLGLAGHL